MIASVLKNNIKIFLDTNTFTAKKNANLIGQYKTCANFRVEALLFKVTKRQFYRDK